MRYTAVSDFTVKGSKGDIAVKAGQALDLPVDKARGLIDRGKIKAISLKWDALSHIHLQVARSLAADKIDFRLSSREIAEAENSLNEIWHTCLKGQASLDDFQAINEKWAGAVRAANKKSKRTTLFESE